MVLPNLEDLRSKPAFGPLDIVNAMSLIAVEEAKGS